MNRFTGVSLLPQQQQQQANQQQSNQQQFNVSNQQSNLFNPNLQQQQQQQQNSLIQQQYMSATQPLNNSNYNYTNTTTNSNSRQYNSNPILQNNNNNNNINNNNNNNINFNNANNSSSPQWFTNSKKRTIPQNIVKRPTFKRGGENKSSSSNKNENDSINNNNNNNNTADDDKSGFNTMSFGSKKIVTFNSDKDLPNNNALTTDNILNDSNEAPPMVSLHDWQREEEFGSMTNSSNTTTTNGNSLFTLRSTKNNSMVSNVKSHMANVNAFDKDSSLRQSTNNTSTAMANNDDSKQHQQQQIEAFAIIVFGYPESVSNMIINHFAKFGNILEDFEILRSATGISKINNNNNNNSNQTKKYPIFTGDGWTKLTYDSQASAIRALQENGKVITGCILGVVPYNKEVVEQLASCKISKDENIGENGIISSIQASTTTNTTTTPILPTLEKNNTTDINTTPQSSIFSINTPVATTKSNNNNNNHTDNNLSQNNNFTFNHRINVKDGKSLFIHNTNTNNHNFLQNLEDKMRQQEQLAQAVTTSGPNANSKIQGNNANNQGLLHSVNNWLFGWNNL